MERMRASRTAGAGAGGDAGGGGAGSGGAPQMVMRVERGGGSPGNGGAQVTVGGPPPNGELPTLNFVAPSELPDYKPVFGPGAVRADADDRLWIRTIPTRPTPGGAIYDVIDRAGKLVDRVQVPVSTTIAGFGKGGVVYLGMRDATGIHLQRAVLSPR